MKRRILDNLLSVVIASYATIAFSGSPHWGHEEQSTWWAIEDTSQTFPPLRYPFAECGVGKHQSPVDLASAEINEIPLNPMEILYDVDAPAFYNSGHGVQVNTSLDYTGALKIGDESFPLIQFHFHEPSEHVLGNTRFPAELHYVHVQDDGRIVVLAVAVNVGDENPTFQAILDNTPHTAGEKNENSGLQINPAALLPPLDHPIKYYTLAGSLTTPPCSEGVQWYILPKAITISGAQLDQLKSIYTHNARLPQDLNERSLLTIQ